MTHINLIIIIIIIIIMIKPARRRRRRMQQPRYFLLSRFPSCRGLPHLHLQQSNCFILNYDSVKLFHHYIISYISIVSRAPTSSSTTVKLLHPNIILYYISPLCQRLSPLLLQQLNCFIICSVVMHCCLSYSVNCHVLWLFLQLCMMCGSWKIVMNFW